MRDSRKKNILISSITIAYILLLYISSNLTYIQIGITIIFGGIIYRASTSDKKPLKYTGASIGLLGTCAMLVLGYFPLYQNKPNSNLYTQIQSRKIFVQSENETSTIKITQGDFSQKQEISKTSKEIFLKESPLSTIIFSSKKGYITIQYPDQTTIYIYPNTTFSLQLSGKQQIIEKIYGTIEYTTGNTNQTIIKNGTQKNMSDFGAQGLIQNYQNKQKDFLLKQAGGALMENQTIRAISHTILIMASKVWPSQYLDYLENEKQYYKLLGRVDINRQTSFDKQTDKINQEMMDNASFGQEKTRFLKYFQKNE